MKEIIKTLQAFQDGYTKRDVTNIETFVNRIFVDAEDTMIIGTGDGEWCRGLEQIKELVNIDWTYWGNFKLDLDKMIIKSFSNFATVSTTAVLQKEYEPGKLNEYNINRMKRILDSDSTDKEKIYLALKGMSYYLHEDNVGEDVKRKVRFSGTLLDEQGVWKFSDIHFSYPVSPPTDIKVI